MNNRIFNSISELLEYKDTLKLSSDSIFSQYLSKIYTNLLKREEIFRHSNSINITRNSQDLNEKNNFNLLLKNSSNISQQKNKIVDKGISLKTFLEYMDIQEFIGERIFKYLKKSKTIKLNKNDFCEGLNELFYGDIRNLIKFTFSLADFNRDGMIYKSDMKLILAYIPAPSELMQKMHIQKINKIINNFFETKIEKPEEGGEQEINYNSYLNYIEEYMNNDNHKNCGLVNDYSDNAPFFYYISILSYLFKNCPFNAKNVDYFIYRKQKMKLKILRNSVRSLSQKKILSTSKKDLNSTVLLNKFDSSLGGIIQTVEKDSKKVLIDAAISKIDKKNLFKSKKSSSQINIRRENRHSSLKQSKTLKLDKKKKDYIIAKEKEEKNDNILSINSLKEQKISTNKFNKRSLKSKKTVSPQNHENLFKKASSPIIGNITNQSFLLNKVTASPELNKNKNLFNSSNSRDTNGSNSNNNSSNNLVNINNKTKLPSIFANKEREKKQKIIPLSVGTKLKDEIDVLEEPEEFVLCEYPSDENDSDKINKNNSKDFNNDDNNLDSNEIYLYKLNEDDNSSKKILTKYYAMLSEKEILFFTSELKNELSDIWFIDKTFILTNKEHINGSNYYTIIITFSNHRFNKLYFLTEKTCQNFAQKIKESIKDLDFDQHYELLEELGRGHFGKVCKCKNKTTGNIFAVKVINKTSMKSKDLELIQQEKNYLKLIKHPNIISLKDYYEDKKNIFLITECFNGGDILTFLDNKQKGKEKVSEKEAAKIIKRIADGIKYLNFFGIIHRDIKPENIMFADKKDTKSLKIIDLGVCKTLTYGEMASEPIGTNGYISPEIYMHHNYSFKIDVWSLGVILYLLITGGILPFDDEKMDSHVIGKKVIYLQQEYPEEYFGNKSKGLIILLDKMLEKNYMKRINISEVIKDSWFEILKK